MRAALIAFAALMIAAPAHAADPWAETTVSVGAGNAVTETPRSGFGSDFAGVQSGALDGDAADALADIAPAAGGDGKPGEADAAKVADEAAAVEPAAGDVKTGNPFITEDGGEPVEFAPGDKENKIIGP